MKKILFSIVTIVFCQTVFAQENPDAPVMITSRARMLRTQATITPAWSVGANLGGHSGAISGGRTNIYAHGTAEYYFTENISVRGDLFYFINKNKVNGGMKHNHAVEVGASYHLIKKGNLDPFVGIAAGLNFAQIYPANFFRAPGDTIRDYVIPSHLDPVWGPRVGLNFFGQKVFHFFIEAHYMMGAYRPAVGPVLSLNELRVSAGLGWNWVFLKKEATVRPTI
jgi:hypothetical protein